MHFLPFHHQNAHNQESHSRERDDEGEEESVTLSLPQIPLYLPHCTSSINNMSMSHHSNNGNNNGNTETVLFDKLQGFSSSLRRERDDAYRQNQLAGERCRAVQEEWTALQKTVTDLKEKLGGLQEGEKLKVEIETTKQKTTQQKTQVDFQHADLVQKRDVVVQLRTGQQARVHQYRDVVTNLETLIESRRARLTVSQESLHKELYLQLIKHVSMAMEPSNMVVVSPESNNSNAESVGSSTMNKNFLQQELLSRDSLDTPPEDEEDWQKYQSKWTRLVQAVADNVYEQAVSPTAHQCAVLERVVQGYQHRLGLEAGMMQVDGGGGSGTGDQELESTNKSTTTTTTVANAMDTNMNTTTGTLLSTGTTNNAFMDDGDAGNTGSNELTGMHHPAANGDQQVDKTVLLPMMAETAYAASEHVQE